MEKPLYEVQIAGMTLKLRSSHDSKTVDELVQTVNDKVQEVQNHSTRISPQSALVLAGLHLAEDLILMKRSAQLELCQLETRACEILSDLDRESTTISQTGMAMKSSP